MIKTMKRQEAVPTFPSGLALISRTADGTKLLGPFIPAKAASLSLNFTSIVNSKVLAL